MLRILTIAAILGVLCGFPASEEICVTYVEKVNCTDKEKTELLYTCESRSENDCLCDLYNPLLSEIGWFKTCHTKNSLKIRKKKVRKRQIAATCNPPCENGGTCLSVNFCACTNDYRGDACQYHKNLCGTIFPPKPGKVSCSVSREDIQCIGTCDFEFKFVDGMQEHAYSCRYADGMWKPRSIFPPCAPTCNPPCENGGTCQSVNVCACTNDYRGDACQYPITLCGFSKNRLASNWKCNHTRTDTACDISCHAPDTTEAELDVYRYECSFNGEWNPSLPPCVQVLVCGEPKIIHNGHWQLLIGQIFNVGSRVAYSCEKDFVLQGEIFLTCDSTLTWSHDAPTCVHHQVISVCTDPGDVQSGRRNISSSVFFEGSTISYECFTNFVLLGNPVIKCMHNRQWSSRKPQCVPGENVPAFCSTPNAPKNSLVHIAFPGQHPLTTAFNRDIPRSQRLYVINYAQEQESEFSNVSERTFVVGTRVQYKCKNRFYKLYGSEYQTCLSSRTWSGYQPACVPECGRSDSPKTPFIVNGNSSRIGQWPWQVGLAFKSQTGLQLLCGGVLISELWVLTAAHCVAKKLSNIPMDARELLVFFGKYYRNFDRDDEYVQVRQVRQVVMHEEYDFIHFDVDIALLQLEAAVELTTRVQPICLPTEDTTRENIRDGKMGIVIGWGLTENGKFSDTLKETVMPVVGYGKCEEAYREGLRSVTITKNMFCAGHQSGQSDTCNGDSGGPYMFAVGPANDNRWYLEGIVSWGSESGCGTALRYSGFTKVGRFVPWINMFI